MASPAFSTMIARIRTPKAELFTADPRAPGSQRHLLTSCRTAQRARLGACVLTALFTFLGAGAAHAQFGAPPPPLLPPPAPPTPASNQTVQQLEQAERQDSGRRLQFAWLNPEVGFQWASLTGLSNSGLLDDRVPADATGLVVGGGAGVRLLYLTLGARFRYGLLSEFDLWSLGAEGALRIPYGNLEPYVFVGAGYTRAGSFKADEGLVDLAARKEDLSVSGIGAQLGGGLDYFVTPVFSVGARVEAQAMFLGRSQTLAAGGGIYSEDGSGIGISTSGLAVLGLHF